MPLLDHPMRYQLANELHARPFPTLSCPGQAMFLAIKQPVDAAKRDRGLDRAHLLALLDRFGAQHPSPDATHYFAKLGRHYLKWESHTEFVTYTAFTENGEDRPFDTAAWEVFPDDWLSTAPGTRVTSAHIRYAPLPRDEKQTTSLISEWFVPESVAVSSVLDDAAIIAGDFHIDPAGHMRFAVFVNPNTGNRRIGRIVQRICEIETYKAMSMLGLPRARGISEQMGAIDADLSTLINDLTGDLTRPEDTLDALLSAAAKLEKIQSEATFRFDATRAYAALVAQRIDVLREERFKGRQTFGEFMLRRFDPAMRTVRATEHRLHGMTDRAIRAGELLRTRVDVNRSAQNQLLLESMDRRSDLQLRLQTTVEGLSIVAISYYAVSLVTYLLAPLAEPMGISKTLLTSLLVLPIVAMVWAVTHAIKRSIHK